MEEAFSEEIRPTLDLIDRLRDVGLNKEISLPQIVVMGDQSSGKSSVLQSISGIPFPRGTGLVTKCPVELIMKKAAANTPWNATVSVRWNEDQPEASGSVNTVEDLASRIKQLSDILSSRGTNGFSHHSIVVRVLSPDAPDLTLIDLPGIVRTATAGQDRNVIQQVNALIDSYMILPNTLILAVVPSNQDIATIDILERAARADPGGVRTIGVLTKPDLIGPGSEEEVVQVVMNIRKPLKLGYIMVKNTSTASALNDAPKTVRKTRLEEEKYFQSHPIFSQSYYQRPIFGSRNLIRVLSQLLVSHIRTTLPTINKEVKSLLQDYKAQFTIVNGGISSSSASSHSNSNNTRDTRQSLLMKKVNEYCLYFRKTSRGEYKDINQKLQILHVFSLSSSSSSSDSSSTSSNTNNLELRLHARMSDSFKVMQDGILQLRPMFTVSSQQQQQHEGDNAKSEELILLETEFSAQKGRELPGFINTQVFVSCMIHFIERWRPYVEDSAYAVTNSTVQVAQRLSSIVFAEYPALRIAIDDLVKQLIDELSEQMKGQLDIIFAQEQDPFTTQDVLLEVVNSIRFRSFDSILRQVLDTTDVKKLHENNYQVEEEVKKRLGNWYMRRHGVDNQGNIQEMITLLQAYWDIASRRCIDNICMTIEKGFLLKLIAEVETQSTLFTLTLSEEDVIKLMEEDVEIATKKKDLREKISTLEAAVQVLTTTSVMGGGVSSISIK